MVWGGITFRYRSIDVLSYCCSTQRTLALSCCCCCCFCCCCCCRVKYALFSHVTSPCPVLQCTLAHAAWLKHDTLVPEVRINFEPVGLEWPYFTVASHLVCSVVFRDIYFSTLVPNVAFWTREKHYQKLTFLRFPSTRSPSSRLGSADVNIYKYIYIWIDMYRYVYIYRDIKL